MHMIFTYPSILNHQHQYIYRLDNTYFLGAVNSKFGLKIDQNLLFCFVLKKQMGREKNNIILRCYSIMSWNHKWEKYGLIKYFLWTVILLTFSGTVDNFSLKRFVSRRKQKFNKCFRTKIYVTIWHAFTSCLRVFHLT
jgi:hypothetical protein